MKELYITSSNINGNGTKETPFNSFSELKKSIDCDTIVYIRGGRYFFKETLSFENTDYNIVFKPYENEEVYFDGGIVLDWKKAKPISDNKIKDRIIDKTAKEKILEIDLSEYDIKYAKYGTRGFRRATIPSGNELYINSEPYNVARYPNVGEPLIPIKTVIDSGSIPVEEEFDMRPATFVYEDKRCDLWKDAKGFYVSGIFNWGFADDTMEIAEIDTENKTLKTVLPHLAGFRADTYTNWFAVNLLEEIDVPGEYFVDSETKKVYFYPTESIENALIQLSVLGEPMIALENCSNITFEGITFENSRSTGVYIENGENCLIKDCVFRNLGMIGVQIGKGATILPEGKHTAHGIMAEGVPNPKSESRIIGSWHEMLYQYAAWNNEGGKNHGVVNCKIYNTGTGGIMLSGGDRKTLEPAGNYVHNCEIYKVNRLDRTYKAGINIMGVGNRISNCEIYDMPGFAIYLHGNDHIIEYNDIHNVVTEVADAGAFYMGRDVTEVGTVIRYNHFHDISMGIDSDSGVSAIYFDDYACFNCIHNNYFTNINGGRFPTIVWNKGIGTSVSRNLFTDCPLPLKLYFYNSKAVKNKMSDESTEQHRRAFAAKDDITGVDIRTETYKNAYPYLYELYFGVHSESVNIWNNRFVDNKNKYFVDFENGDLTLRDDTFPLQSARDEIYDSVLGIENGCVNFGKVDFKKIGIQKGE